ncbi:MAG: hypothetical protein ACTXOO_05330 [Sodalis sp. (in: enterobacteria)]
MFRVERSFKTKSGPLNCKKITCLQDYQRARVEEGQIAADFAKPPK